MRILCCLSILAIASASNAQRSSDPAVNLQVTDAIGSEGLTEPVPKLDGGCSASWLDDMANGFDVRLQRLDVAGRVMFAHNGILVADRTRRWTVDHPLNIDASGNALLAFRIARGDTSVIAAAFEIAPFSVSSAPNGKSRVAAPRQWAGFSILAWSDGRAGAADIYAQNVLPDGALGSPIVDAPLEGEGASSAFIGAPCPNPTSEITRIEYSAAASGPLALEIYDVRGRGVRTLSAPHAQPSGAVA